MAGSSYRPVSRWRLGCPGPAAGAARQQAAAWRL